MENENSVPQTQEESSMVYVVGAIIVVAVIVAAVVMWPKNKAKETATPTATTETSVVTKPTLTKLVCESEWFNPVVGLPKYYLSAQGGDVSAGQEIECTFNIVKDKETVVTETVKVPVKQAPERGGTTFQCTSKALEKLPQNVPVTFVTVVKNENGEAASCSGSVTFR